MILCEKVSKIYRGTVALDDFSMELKDGEHAIITGPSGAGKTTLMRLLLGLDKPTGGTVTVRKGKQRKGTPDEEKRTAVMFQEDRLIEERSFYDNIKTFVPKMTAGQLGAEAKDVLLSDTREKKSGKSGEPVLIDTLVKEFSGGMKRRVALLRALLAPSDFVFLDEPFSGLDQNTKEACIRYINKKTEGKTLVVFLHEPEEGLEAGQVIELKPKQEIKIVG